MKRTFYAVSVVVGFLAVSCSESDPEHQPSLPEIRIEMVNPRLDIDYTGKTVEVKVVSNRDFEVVNSVEWIAVDVPKLNITPGKDEEVLLSVTALQNGVGNERTATVRFRTISTYVDLTVAQAANPDAAPTLVYSTSFGKTLNNLDNPLVTKSDCWMGFEEGVCKNVEYYMPSGAKVSVRNSSTNSSSGYSEASGDNFLWFGTAGEFAVGKISVHNLLESMKISFGLQKAVYGSIDNNINVAEFPVWISKDGQSWKSFEYEVRNPVNGAWSLCEGTFAVSDDMSELYIRFKPTKTSSYRFDDLKVSNGGKGGKEIDWDNNPESYDLPSPITFD